MPKPKLIETPDLLKRMWGEYTSIVDKTPDIEEVVSNKGTIVKVKRKRPYLRAGFEAYVYKQYGFHVHQYIDNYKNAYPEYLGVVTHIRNEWAEDQLSGALTGRYKAPNLVARLNGLADKTENKTEIKLEQITGMEIK